MFVRRSTVLLWAIVVTGGLYSVPDTNCSPQAPEEGWLKHPVFDDHWLQHPALMEPDGISRRGGKMVADDVRDPRIIAELSRRFRATQAMGFVNQQWTGTDDFERRQEYLLRLLDFYHFSANRLAGMSRAKVQEIFGAGDRCPPGNRLSWSAGRDVFVVWFRKGRVAGSYYVMGY